MRGSTRTKDQLVLDRMGIWKIADRSPVASRRPLRTAVGDFGSRCPFKHWANIHYFLGLCPLRLACIVCARGERSRLETRRPDSASIPRYASGGLASSKCKPSYMKRTRTACTVPPRTWCTTGGSLGIGGAIYGVLCRQWRTNPIFAKREIWGRNISSPLLKGPKRRSRLPGRSVHHSPRRSPTPNVDRRARCNASDEARPRRDAESGSGVPFTAGLEL